VARRSSGTSCRQSRRRRAGCSEGLEDHPVVGHGPAGDHPQRLDAGGSGAPAGTGTRPGRDGTRHGEAPRARAGGAVLLGEDDRPLPCMFGTVRNHRSGFNTLAAWRRAASRRAGGRRRRPRTPRNWSGEREGLPSRSFGRGGAASGHRLSCTEQSCGAGAAGRRREVGRSTAVALPSVDASGPHQRHRHHRAGARRRPDRGGRRVERARAHPRSQAWSRASPNSSRVVLSRSAASKCPAARVSPTGQETISVTVSSAIPAT
jgi:hypothetical protein